MSQPPRKPLDKKKVITSIVVVSALAGTGYEVNRLSADPVGGKDCPPVFAGPLFVENSVIDTQVNVECGSRLSSRLTPRWA